MASPELPEQLLETPPIEVAELVASHPDYVHEKRWERLGPDEAPTVREALGIAEQLRQDHVDPGDAFLQGLSYAEAVRRERIAREEFVRDMEPGAGSEPAAEKPHRLRSMLRNAGAALIVFTTMKPTSGSDVGV